MPARHTKNWECKRRIKTQIVIDARELIQYLLRFTEGTNNDHTLINKIKVPDGKFCSHG